MRRTAVPHQLHKMPSAKVVPMKCGPDCTGLQCHPTMAAPSNLRKQSNSSCSSSSVATPSIHSNGSLCNNLNGLNTPSSLITSNLVYDPATAPCSGGNCTSNCSSCSNCLSSKPSLPVCTKACCSRNTHLVTLPNQKPARHSASAASNTTAFPMNGGGSSCACCSPASGPPAATRTGLRLQTSKCTDQCYLSNKPSSAGGQCCNVNSKPSGQTTASLNPTTGQAKPTTALTGSISSHAIANQTHYDHRLNQSAQACQMLDNDRVYGGEFSEISFFFLLSTDQACSSKYTFYFILRFICVYFFLSARYLSAC